MNDYQLAALIVGAVIIAAVAWELWLIRTNKTPIPDAFRKAFDNAG